MRYRVWDRHGLRIAEAEWNREQLTTCTRRMYQLQPFGVLWLGGFGGDKHTLGTRKTGIYAGSSWERPVSADRAELGITLSVAVRAFVAGGNTSYHALCACGAARAGRRAVCKGGEANGTAFRGGGTLGADFSLGAQVRPGRRRSFRAIESGRTRSGYLTRGSAVTVVATCAGPALYSRPKARLGAILAARTGDRVQGSLLAVEAKGARSGCLQGRGALRAQHTTRACHIRGTEAAFCAEFA